MRYVSLGELWVGVLVWTLCNIVWLALGWFDTGYIAGSTVSVILFTAVYSIGAKKL